MQRRTLRISAKTWPRSARVPEVSPVLQDLDRPKSGHITCYLNRTYHVLTTVANFSVARWYRSRVWWSLL